MADGEASLASGVQAEFVAGAEALGKDFLAEFAEGWEFWGRFEDLYAAIGGFDFDFEQLAIGGDEELDDAVRKARRPPKGEPPVRAVPILRRDVVTRPMRQAAGEIIILKKTRGKSERATERR